MMSPAVGAPEGALWADASFSFFHASGHEDLRAAAATFGTFQSAAPGEALQVLAGLLKVPSLPPPAAALSLRVVHELGLPPNALSFDEPSLLDYGLLCCGTETSRGLTLRNSSNATVAWSIERAAGIAPMVVDVESETTMVTAEGGGRQKDQDNFSEFSFSPASGFLAPRSSTLVQVTIIAGLHPERLRAAVAVHGTLRDAPSVQRRRSQPLPPTALTLVSAEIASPLASLSPLALSLGVAFVGVPVTRRITIQNLCALNVEWKIDPYVGFVPPPAGEDVHHALVLARERRDEARRPASSSSSSSASASLLLLQDPHHPHQQTTRSGSPRSRRPVRQTAPNAPYHISATPSSFGSLGPLESLEIELTITPLSVGRVDSFIAIDIAGAPLPLALAFSATVRDVTLAFAFIDNATGVVGPASADAATAEAAFAAELAEVGSDASDPTVVAVNHAFARAREAGASLGTLPSLSFSGPRPVSAWSSSLAALRSDANALAPRIEPLALHARAAHTLLVFNLSGIPTTIDVSVDALGTPGGDNVDWPTSYAEASSVLGGGGISLNNNLYMLPKESSDYKGLPRGPLRVALPLQWGVQPSNNTTSMGDKKYAVTRRPPMNGSSSSTNAPPRLSDAHEAVSRFTSLGGRALVASQETALVYARALGRCLGAAIDIFPSRGVHLPAFGCAAFAVGAVADVPGTYTDRLHLRSTADKGQVSTLVTFGVSGNPLSFLPGPAGLRCTNAGLPLDPQVPIAAGYLTGPPLRGVRSSELNFGDLAEGANTVTTALTISNSSCLDAWLTWHSMHDRAPGSIIDPLALEMSIAGGGGEGEDEEGGENEESDDVAEMVENGGDDNDGVIGVIGDENAVSDIASVPSIASDALVGHGDSLLLSAHSALPSPILKATSLLDNLAMPSVSIELRPHTDRTLHKHVPSAFQLTPMSSSLRVPAHGRAVIHVSFAVRAANARDAAVARAMGWAKEAADAAGGGGEDELPVKVAVDAALSMLRGRFVADAIFVTPGVKVPDELTDRSHAPQTPENDKRVVDVGVGVASDVPLKQEDEIRLSFGPPPAALVRDALTLHTAARPFVPHLLVDCGVLGADGDYAVKWSLSSSAAAAAREARARVGANFSHESATAATATTTGGAAGSAMSAARARSSGRNGGGGIGIRDSHLHNATSSALVANAIAAHITPSLPASAVHTITLTNPAVSALAVTLFVTGPFVLLSAAAAVPHAPLVALLPAPQGGRSLVLPGSASVAVTVAFDASAGAGLRVEAATVLLGGTSAARALIDAPTNVFTSTVREGGGGRWWRW